MVQPDSLDKRILRELESPLSLQWNIRESFASVAKKLDVDEETVRHRVARMREARILAGWQLVVNPHLIGREGASVELEVQDQEGKARAIERLKLVEGVISLIDFHGPRLQAGVYYRHEAALVRQVALMDSVCGLKHSSLWRLTFPPCELRMSRTDWALLRILLEDPRMKVGDIAAKAGASTRTVNRRLGRMVGEHAFFLHAVIDFRRLGGLAYRMLVQVGDPRRKTHVDDAVLRELEEKIDWSYTLSDEYSMFVLYCENVAEAREASGLVGRLKGVEEVRMDIVEDQITVNDWVEDEIATTLGAI